MIPFIRLKQQLNRRNRSSSCLLVQARSLISLCLLCFLILTSCGRGNSPRLSGTLPSSVAGLESHNSKSQGVRTSGAYPLQQTLRPGQSVIFRSGAIAVVAEGDVAGLLASEPVIQVSPTPSGNHLTFSLGRPLPTGQDIESEVQSPVNQRPETAAGVYITIHYDPSLLSSSPADFYPGLDDRDLLLFTTNRTSGLVPIAIVPTVKKRELPSGQLFTLDFVSGHEDASSKRVLKAPSEVENKITQVGITDNEDGTVTFSWTLLNVGDFNLDGNVTAIDVSPIAFNFSQAAADGINKVMDDAGNESGIVDAGDLSPVAFHFGNQIDGYRIYETSVLDGFGNPQFPPDHLILLGGSPGDPVSVFKNIAANSGSSLDFSVTIPKPAQTSFYKFVPYDISQSQAGIESDIFMFEVIQPQPPIAVAGANPTDGFAPLPVNFTADASSDPNGQIVKWEWDFGDDGDPDYDFVSVSQVVRGNIGHTYLSSGTFTATLRVTDDESLTATDTIDITVGTPNAPPVANANADKTSGQPPLAVNFNAAGSTDPDGTIVQYRWDYTTDGTWDVSNATGDGSFTYNNFGTYTATLQVTDDKGATATDPITIQVSTWVITPVDLPGDVGEYNSLAISPGGKVGVAYYDATNTNLKYAEFNGVTWSTRTLDSSGALGEFTSIVFDQNNNAHISYFDDTPQSGFPIGKLKYARQNGANWNVFVIDTGLEGPNLVENPGRYSSIALDPNGNPRIAYTSKYYSWGVMVPKIAVYNGSIWTDDFVTDSVGNTYVAEYTRLVINSGGLSKIMFRDSGVLRMATESGSAFSFSDGPQPSGDVGLGLSMVLDPTGNPAISYYDYQNGQLKYSVFNGSSWNAVTVDTNGDVGIFSSLAYNPLNNQPGIAYFDQTNGRLKLAKFEGTWTITTIDQVGVVGIDCNLKFTSDGRAVISYYDRTNGDLKVAIQQ